MTKLKIFKPDNQSGFTLIEMLATIVVTSILTVILMQMLMLTLTAQVELETENRYLNESYIITEQIRDRIFELEPQEIELISDDATQTVIEIRHLNDYTTDSSDNIIELPNVIIKQLVLDKVNGDIYFDGVQINKTSVNLGSNTSFELISINPSVCDLATRECEEGFIELTLEIEIILPGGETLDPKIYVSKILV